MEWVVGTGRCGMHNYTALNGGFIQSRKAWKQEAIKKYHGEEWDKKHVENVIRERMNFPYPCVTDCSQFMFIDDIRRVDKKAKFVWLVRDREECIKCFMNKVGEADRIHPKGWRFETSRKRDLISWYYDEVNSIINKYLSGANYEIIKTETMPKASLDKIEELRKFA